LYVKDGGIIPMIPPVLRAPKRGEILRLELRHYGELDGSIFLYDDDGETFNYEKGNYMRYTFTAIKNGNGKWIGKESFDNKNKMIQQYNNFKWKFMTGL
jgi:alpha-D-xyloside xylohydrolase